MPATGWALLSGQRSRLSAVFKQADEAHQDCRNQLTELVVQNYNHPSIMFWGISNEILIGGISQKLVDCHHDLQKLCRSWTPPV